MTAGAGYSKGRRTISYVRHQQDKGTAAPEKGRPGQRPQEEAREGREHPEIPARPRCGLKEGLKPDSGLDLSYSSSYSWACLCSIVDVVEHEHADDHDYDHDHEVAGRTLVQGVRLAVMLDRDDVSLVGFGLGRRRRLRRQPLELLAMAHLLKLEMMVAAPAAIRDHHQDCGEDPDRRASE